MPSLKEVKNRINSVNSTKKITSAMKMVASAKLHSARKAIESMRPYESRLNRIMAGFVSAIEGDIASPYATERPVQRIAFVVYSSNSGLCGGFNSNIVRELKSALDDCRAKGIEVEGIYPVGKKACDAVKKMGYDKAPDLSDLADHPAYTPAAELAQSLMDKFAAGTIDKAVLIYHHFKSAGTQVLTRETFLPVSLNFEQKSEDKSGFNADYIVEPDKATLLVRLVPKALHLKVFTALLDSVASEHAARVVAMQVATDNADDLLQELTLQYNKTRQQAITSELLDIVGGSMQ